MSDNRRSTSDVERDVEKNRAELDETVDELKDRFSPGAMADYGMDYMRGPGGQRLLGAVRDNPLAAALALAGIGWLFYTASQPEEERRIRRARRGARYRAAEDWDEAYLRDEDLYPDEVDFRSRVTQPYPGMPGGTASSGTGRQGTSHPGMMGDETEEQNLDQPGKPGARISQEEVEDAFRQGRERSDLGSSASATKPQGAAGVSSASTTSSDTSKTKADVPGASSRSDKTS